jgi:hypothetical protein
MYDTFSFLSRAYSYIRGSIAGSDIQVLDPPTPSPPPPIPSPSPQRSTTEDTYRSRPPIPPSTAPTYSPSSYSPSEQSLDPEKPEFSSYDSEDLPECICRSLSQARPEADSKYFRVAAMRFSLDGTNMGSITATRYKANDLRIQYMHSNLVNNSMNNQGWDSPNFTSK